MLLGQSRLLGNGQGFGALDHAFRRRAARAVIGHRETRRREAWNMHGLKFEALASVDGHETDGINMKSSRRNLAQIALFHQQNKLTHPIQRSLDRNAGASWTPFAHEIQELPKSDPAH